MKICEFKDKERENTLQNTLQKPDKCFSVLFYQYFELKRELELLALVYIGLSHPGLSFNWVNLVKSRAILESERVDKLKIQEKRKFLVLVSWKNMDFSQSYEEEKIWE